MTVITCALAILYSLLMNYSADTTIYRTRSRKKGNDDKLESILTQASQLACDIKDLRDELNMLRSIVNSQLTVQKEMPGNTKGSSSITGQYFSKDLEELENVAKTTQESVSEHSYRRYFIIQKANIEYRSIQS